MLNSDVPPMTPIGRRDQAPEAPKLTASGAKCGWWLGPGTSTIVEHRQNQHHGVTHHAISREILPYTLPNPTAYCFETNWNSGRRVKHLRSPRLQLISSETRRRCCFSDPTQIAGSIDLFSRAEARFPPRIVLNETCCCRYHRLKLLASATLRWTCG